MKKNSWLKPLFKYPTESSLLGSLVKKKKKVKLGDDDEMPSQPHPVYRLVCKVVCV